MTLNANILDGNSFGFKKSEGNRMSIVQWIKLRKAHIKILNSIDK